METVNMHEAKTHLSRLVRKAAAGEPFVIAIAGKPMVRVMALEEGEMDAQVGSRGLGALKGQFTMPDDLKEAFRDEIEEMFYGKP